MNPLLTDDYRDQLITRIAEIGVPGGKVYFDAQAGSLYVETPHHDIYATPGWEGEWTTLPIDVINEDWDSVLTRSVTVRFMGAALDRDAQLWLDNVLPIVRAYQ